MATGPVSAVQVGSYFVGQYYQVLQRHPELVHQFYNDVSSMVRVDGDSTLTADTILKIHTVIMSLNFITTEIKTINSLRSWGGGVLVMVSGTVRMSDYKGQRKFVQSFFLAPQEKGFFVLNDIFHFLEEKPVIEDYDAPQLSENISDSLLGVSNSLPEAQVSDYGLEEEAIDYVQSLNVGDALLDNYGFEKEQHLQYSEQQSEMYQYADQVPAIKHTGYLNNGQGLHNGVADDVREEEPQKITYASILRVSKGQPAASTAAQTSITQDGLVASEWDSKPQSSIQQSHVEASYVPETKEAATEDYSGQDDDGELLKSVYVRNLPASVTSALLEQECKQFGKIKHNGIFIRNRPDIGVCYAFVEYESMDAVHAAIQGSPLELDGTQIYIEERRANAMGAYRGGRRGGRGRVGSISDSQRGGRFSGRGLGRGSYHDAGDYNRQKSNDYHQRSY